MLFQPLVSPHWNQCLPVPAFACHNLQDGGSYIADPACILLGKCLYSRLMGEERRWVSHLLQLNQMIIMDVVVEVKNQLEYGETTLGFISSPPAQSLLIQIVMNRQATMHSTIYVLPHE